MKNSMEYSVLRYSPSIDSGENINLGLLLIDENIDKREFYYSDNYDRIKNFSPKININNLKILLDGIKEEVDKYWDEDNYSIESFTKFYNNTYHFDKPQKIMYDDFGKTADSLAQTFLY